MNFTVYKSSAGSGKTFTLVKEYLKIALKSDDAKEYRRILAITFTNKAAAEMKERVLVSLKSFAGSAELNGTPALLLKDLEKELGEPAHVIRERSKKILGSMLHNYSDIGISTIDKFTHKIIRTFAYDLRIPMNFSIETDADELLKKAIDIVISKVGEDPGLTKALVEFSESKADDEKNWVIENDLLRFSRNLLKEDGVKYLEKIRNINTLEFFEIKNKLQQHIKAFERELSSIGKESLKLISSNGIEHDTFAGGKNGIPKYFFYLSVMKYDSIVPTNTIRRNVDEDKWYAGKATATDKEKIEHIKPRLLELYDKALDLVNANLNEITLFNLINRNIYSLLVLNEIEKAIEEMKLSENILHISEFNKRIAGIVANEPAPFIYERLGERYNHFLIDEFQDTSALQWQNLLPLIDNSLSNGHFNMLVGDAKQAIYRWRGGEVEQFIGLPSIPGDHNELVKEREDALKRNYQGEILGSNWRSKAEIVDFNNKFFSYCIGKEDSGLARSIYHLGEQRFDTKNTGGGVSIEFLKEDQENDVLYDELTCSRVLGIIRQLQSDNFELSDIAILCRNNSKSNILANYLIKNNIGIVSKESLLLMNSPLVNFIVALLKTVNDPGDIIAQAYIIQYLDKEKQRQVDTPANLMNQDFYKFIKNNGYLLNLGYLGSLPIYELCEKLIRDFGLNKKADPYVQFFLDTVFKFSVKNNNSIHDFLIWWEEKKEHFSVTVPEGMNAVNIMTIHKAKGLEFPAVIFAFANWQPGPKDNIWVEIENPRIPLLKAAILPLDKSMENTDFAKRLEEENEKVLSDNLNLLYVACTRPKERLYILTDFPRAQKKLSEYYIGYLKSNGTWEDNTLTYTFGLFSNKTANKKPRTQNTLAIDSFICSPWQQKLEISPESAKERNSLSGQEQKRYGNLVHIALAEIKDASDLDASLFSMLEKGILTSEEQSILKEKIKTLLNTKEIERFFEKGLHVKTEADILLPNGETYRPDRVIIKGTSAVVLDYKTGKENEKYSKQLQQYASILLQMGYLEVEKYLLYTEDLKLEKIN